MEGRAHKLFRCARTLYKTNMEGTIEKTTEKEVVRSAGMRGTGIFAGEYRVRGSDDHLGRKYDIKGLYHLVKANSVRYLMDASVREDLKAYEAYREEQRLKHESPRKSARW